MFSVCIMWPWPMILKSSRWRPFAVTITQLTQKRFQNILKLFGKMFGKCFIHIILYGATYIIKTLSKNIFINPFRNIYKMLYNMLCTHFFRNVTKKPKINKLKMFRKCFVTWEYVPCLTVLTQTILSLYYLQGFTTMSSILTFTFDPRPWKTIRVVLLS